LADHVKYGILLTEFPAKFDLKVVSGVTFKPSMPHPPLLYARRQLRGSGHEWGGLVTEIVNNHDSDLRLVYLETVPWYFRVFFHTLDIQNGGSIVYLYQALLLIAYQW